MRAEYPLSDRMPKRCPPLRSATALQDAGARYSPCLQPRESVKSANHSLSSRSGIPIATGRSKIGLSLSVANAIGNFLLSAGKMRLASIQIINDIRPIEGADRIPSHRCYPANRSRLPRRPAPPMQPFSKCSAGDETGYIISIKQLPPVRPASASRERQYPG